MICFCRAPWHEKGEKYTFTSKRHRTTCPICHAVKASGFTKTWKEVKKEYGHTESTGIPESKV